MKYGYFDDKAREYVITNPDTPQPWINYLGSLEYGAVISNNAAGYSFLNSGANGRLLRSRFNSLNAYHPGRFIYLRDREKKDYWSVSWLPVAKPLDTFKSRCRHGTAYTIIDSTYDKINASVTYYVPLNKLFEVWACTVVNTDSVARKLSLFTYAEMTNHNLAGQDNDNLQYSLYISRTYFKGHYLLQSYNENQTEQGRMSGTPGPGVFRFVGLTGAEVKSYDGCRRSFIGSNRTYANPAAVERGSCSNTLNYAENSAGVLHTDIDLKPGEQRTVIVVFGPGGDEKAKAALDEYKDTSIVDRQVTELKKFWHGQLSNFEVNTPDPLLNTMVNTWNAYECFITFSWCRAASMVYTGERNGLGYRDTVQDLQGIMHLAPELSGKRLRTMLSGQLSSGGALPLVRFDHVPGSFNPGEDRPRYRCDDALWLFPTVDMYIKETGKVEFIDEVIPYADKGKDSVYEHLRRAIRFSLERLGKHGLTLGLEADWNDCLKLGDDGETTFASLQLYWAIKIFQRYASLKGMDHGVKWAEENGAVLLDNLEKYAWEEDRLVRGFVNKDGYVLGSKKNPEGSIFLNPQAWAVISEAVDTDQGCKAMDSVYRELNTPYGVMLCYPGYRKYGLPVVRAILFLPGIKENAGIFCHTQGWAILAEALLGRGNRAWEYYNNCNPARMNEQAEVRQIEPYVHCQFVEGKESPYHGRAHNPWLTGTASTVQVSAVKGILGVQPEFEGLRIDPSIPSSWDGFSMKRVFRGKKLFITVDNKAHVEHGVSQIIINGKALSGSLIPEREMKAENTVEVIMGK